MNTATLEAPAPTLDLAQVRALALPDMAGPVTGAQRLLTFVEAFAIDTQEAYDMAAEELATILNRADKLEAQRTGLTKPLNAVLRGINDLFRSPAETLTRAAELLKRKMIGYEQEQLRIADEQRRIAEVAAAAERRRLEAEAAVQRQAAEEATRQAAEAQRRGDADAAALAAAEAQRKAAEAQATATTAMVVTAAPPPPTFTKAAGTSTRESIDFDVTSLKLLVAYIATGKVYAEGDTALAHPELIGLLAADEVRLRAYVKGIGMACNLPGLRVFPKHVLASRRK